MSTHISLGQERGGAPDRMSKGGLFIVATPIGNLEDMTYRGVRVLKEVDAIVCEDTRVTSKLLAHFEIQKPTVSLHQHTSEQGIERLLVRLERGESLAYVSDAGTPGVNDPGGKLVEAAYRRGIRIEPIPGSSALTTAISVCGFPMDEFHYYGFVPHKKGRETLFKQMAADERSCVFFESTHRAEKTLEALSSVIGSERLLFCGRELTKMHETLYRGSIDEVRQALQASSLKGEFVFILGPAK